MVQVVETMCCRLWRLFDAGVEAMRCGCGGYAMQAVEAMLCGRSPPLSCPMK